MTVNGSATAPVIAGLVIGVGFIVMLSLAVTAASIPKGALMLTTEDGRSYTASLR